MELMLKVHFIDTLLQQLEDELKKELKLTEAVDKFYLMKARTIITNYIDTEMIAGAGGK